MNLSYSLHHQVLVSVQSLALTRLWILLYTLAGSGADRPALFPAVGVERKRPPRFGGRCTPGRWWIARYQGNIREGPD